MTRDLLADKDPMERFRAALARVEAAGVPMSNALIVALATPDGKPSVRMMLLKGADARGFVFYTNERSRKGREIAANPRAAIGFWWPLFEEQVRAEGILEKVSPAEADAYFASRPRGSQIGAWASRQSEPLSSREELVGAVREIRRKHLGSAVPRPPFWSGFRLVPERIEFWFGRPDRLHDRVLYMRDGTGWKIGLLNP
ncbi:MAG: pyridoxamine 5'-phosphate oxidase [Planctomycetota bacterium]